MEPSYRKNSGPRKYKNNNYQLNPHQVSKPATPALQASLSLSSLSLNPTLSTQLYANIEKAINSLLLSITTECARRISSIKKSTLQATIQISKLKNSLNHLLSTKGFSESSIQKLKDFSSEASFYYKPECEDFNLFIDKTVKDLKAGENPVSLASHYRKGSPAGGRWEIKGNDGKWKGLPEWVVKQIEIGVNYGAAEINIYKKSELVSVADMKKMVYCGLLDGNRLPGQMLRKVS